MASLPIEYTDTKGIKHEVQHYNTVTDHTNNREEIIEELFRFLDTLEKQSSFSDRNTIMKGSVSSGNHPLCP